MKFYIIHGPNINLLGLREPTIYGKENYEALVQFIKNQCDAKQIESVFFQSNHEGDLVDYIQAAYGDAGRYHHKPRRLHSHQRCHS